MKTTVAKILSNLLDKFIYNLPLLLGIYDFITTDSSEVGG